MSTTNSTSSLDEFKDFEEVRIETLDSPDLKHTPRAARLGLQLESLMQQGKGIKYDDFHVPNLTVLIRKRIAQNRYRHKIIGDMHFLIPPKKLNTKERYDLIH
jgi:hypothetical protein